MALATGALLATSASASAASGGGAYVLSDVQCDGNGDGVLDLTLVNDDPSAEALFVLGDVAPEWASSIADPSVAVAPLTAYAVTFTGLADGLAGVSVVVDGVPITVWATVGCDAAHVEVLPSPVRGEADDVTALPRTGSSTSGLLIGGVLVAAGALASLLSRRRYS